MSDFLTHLASRSVNRLPVVQPRLASRFEAISAAPKLNRENIGVMEGETEATISDEETTASVQPSQSSPKEASSQPDGTIRRVTAAAPLLTVKTSEAQPTATSAIQLPEAVNPVPSNTVRPQPLHPFSSLANPSPQPSTRLAVEAAERATRSPVDPLPQSQEDSAQPLQPEKPSNAPVGQPQIMPRPEPSPVNIPAVVVPPTPTIHVTIGRIEVRAQTAATPPSPAPRRPALTLDHYLSQRAGGQA